MSGPKFENDKPLIDAIYNNQVDQYQTMIQSMTTINKEALFAIMSFKSSVDVFNAVMNHPALDPFSGDNSLIKFIIDSNSSTEYLFAVLHSSKNKLTNDDYQKIITDIKPTGDKLLLIQSFIV